MSLTANLDEAATLLIDPAAFTDMDAWHRRMGVIRRATPFVPVQVEGFSPFVGVLRHADISAIERDPELWLNTSRSVLGPDANDAAMESAGIPAPRTLVHLDGQDHRDHRLVTNDWFKPAAVKRLQPMVDEVSDIFIERMRELGGECDFARDIAQPFTLKVIMEIFGVPEEDRQLMLELTQGLFGAADPEFMGDAADPLEAAMGAVMKFINYFGAITEDRQKHPTSDLATVIATGMPGGHPMGDAERLWYYIIIATAGHDTTSFAMSGGLEALLRDPDQLWALRDEPELVVNAADEIIRWTTPVRHFLRYATADTSVGGVDIPKGGRVLLCYPSANRDEELFEAPDTFDVRRANSDRTLSFGYGTHFCLGSQVARREIRTMFARLANELESIEAAGPAEWSASGFVSGVKHLPIRYRFK
ncbi:MAG TPA: cytochrome P450 [Acidimicrobiales bacterium]|jgi:cytochrome P450|nr:cytochrome P450 [Acidimicrobiales bacterium]